MSLLMAYQSVNEKLQQPFGFGLAAQITLSITSVCIGLGYIFLIIGKPRLIAANRIPTEEEDLKAMEDNSPTTK